MASMADATYRRLDNEEKYTEHDNALLDAQIALLKQIKNSASYTTAVNLAEAYALISGKLSAKAGDVKTS
jgi:hypothetical protein